MTFTSTTIRKLRALGLDQDTFDKVLEIFEEARESKPKKKGCAADRQERATRLPDDWVLPDDWRAFVFEQDANLNADEIASVFRDYWVAKPGAAGRKLDWEATWRNWVRRSPAAKTAQRPSVGQRAADQVGRLTGNSDQPKTFDLRVV